MITEAMSSEQAAKIAKKLIERGVVYLKAELAKDAANRYSLKEEWSLPLVDASGLPAGEYHGDVVNIVSDGKLALAYYNPFESTKDNDICDGASRFPDVFLGVNLVPGSVAHDTIYRELEKIAKAFGVPTSVVRRFADRVFTSVNLAENADKPFVKTVSTLTHWGVRAFGGIYHKAKVAVIVSVLAAAFAGCSGCVSTFFENEDDYQSPTVEKTE